MIENIELNNFISHRETSMALENGVNVFIGPNGAGKSSILDAVTYALYGEHTRDSAKNILRRGAIGGSVSVRFGIGGREYLAERKLGKGGRLESAIFREISPNPRLIVAGERRQYEESMSEEVGKAFGLDYEKMRVAAIVQQGELDSIIRYKPKELKELINSLIGIDKLDLAYRGMFQALEGFRSKLRAECMNYDDQSIDAILAEINETSIKLEEAHRQAGEIANSLSKLNLEREKLEGELRVLEPLRGKRGELEERKKELVKYVLRIVSRKKSEVGTLVSAVKKGRRYLSVLLTKPSVDRDASRVEEEHEKFAKTRTGLISDLRSSGNAEDRMKRLADDKAACLRKIGRLRETIQRNKSEISKLRKMKAPAQEKQDQLRLRLKGAEEAEGATRDTLTTIGDTMGNYGLIQQNGVCPTCGSTVEEINLDAKMKAKHLEHTEAKSKHDAALHERDSIRNMLEKRRAYDLAQKRLQERKDLLEEQSGDLKDERKRLGSLGEEARAKSGEVRKIPSMQKKLKIAEAKLGKLEGRRNELRRKQSLVIEAQTWLRENEINTGDDLQGLQEKLADLQRVVGSMPKDLANASFEKLVVDEYSSELSAKTVALSKEVSKFDEATYRRKKVELEETIRPRIIELSQTGGGWKSQETQAREQLSKLRESRARLEEATSYIRLYERIRADVYNRDGILATSLRTWALRELSRNASDYIRSFGMGLSELQLKEQKHEVNIECFSASGIADVRSMSGGEGVAIALALRFAMARLMGKGMVDFVALDEPTTHLDEERKRSLVRLISEFNSDERQTSLGQIIVITHDKEIFEDSEVNAVFQFEKNAGITSVTKS